MTTRRAFLQSTAWTGVALAQTGPAASPVPAERRVYLVGDGVVSTPSVYARLLVKIADEHGASADSYLNGGAVEELEKQFASLLGKERALFLPTGTLANHLAVRELSGGKRRVIVQSESHIYCDESDCAEMLSGLNLIPAAAGRATMTLEEVTAIVERSAGPPFPSPVGAISIESPVRRQMGEVVDFEEMKKVCAFARGRGIGTHLDGARVFLASGYTGISPAAYGALFDAVYVSMYKYFNAPFGAVLAGPAEMMKRVADLRHQFGSMIYHGWEAAAVALHYFGGFTERYQTAVRNGETLMRALETTGKFKIERVKNGSNIATVHYAGTTADVLAEKLARAGVVVRGAKGASSMAIYVNETINRRPAAEIAREFEKAVG